MIQCPSCGKRPAPIHPRFGPLWCEECRKKYEPMNKTPYPEFVPDYIKEDRAKHFKSTIQPYRQGELSKEYLEAYGTKGIKATPEEVKSAKYVWKDLPNWRNRHKTQ